MKKFIVGGVILACVWSANAQQLLMQNNMQGIVGSANSSKAQINSRIMSAQLALSNVISISPNQEVFASAFFANDMSLERVVAVSQSYGLQIDGFRHETPSSTGGYIVDGESVQAAIERYKRDHKFFMEQDLENTKRMLLQSASDPALTKALVARKENILRRLSDFKENGIRVIGLDLRGEAIALAALQAQQTFIRFIELRSPGVFGAAILPSEGNEEK